ncbi:CdaR family protein [Polaribacter sp.]|uniref:CdaR family protein n=1 Tax=Polaribacter sp. TaxID=1920175 RepID=UPI003EF63F16
MKKNNKISKTFISFLIASISIWLLITLSKEYVTNINLPVLYTKIPQDKILQTPPKNNIELVVKATGFNIIRAKFKNKPISLAINKSIKKSSNNYYLLTTNQLTSIQQQLLSNMQLQEIIQDTIFLELGSLTSKKIPIKSNLELNFHIGYDLVKDIEISPDSILVSGPESQIKNIKQILLTPLKLKDIKADFSKNIAILKPKNSNNLKFKTTSVTVKGKVEKFTEGSFKVPFNIINLPKNIQLTSLAKTIDVYFIISLSHFNAIDADSFEIECDYSISEKNNLEYLIPKLVSKSNLIKSYKLVPNQIDFLIQK